MNQKVKSTLGLFEGVLKTEEQLEALRKMLLLSINRLSDKELAAYNTQIRLLLAERAKLSKIGKSG